MASLKLVVVGDHFGSCTDRESHQMLLGEGGGNTSVKYNSKGGSDRFHLV